MTATLTLESNQSMRDTVDIKLFPRLYHHFGERAGVVEFELNCRILSPELLEQKEIFGHALLRAKIKCERCRQEFDYHLHRPFHWLLIKAGQTPVVSDVNVEVLEENIDMMELFEDEMILSLPIFYKHEACELPFNGESLEEAQGAFAALRNMVF